MTPGASANGNAPRRRPSRQPIKRRRSGTPQSLLFRARSLVLARGLRYSGDCGHSPLPAGEVQLQPLTRPRVPPGRHRQVYGEGPGAGAGEAAGRPVQQWVTRGGAAAAQAQYAHREAAAAGEQERPAGGRLEGRAAPQRGGQRAEPPQPGGRLLVHPALAGRGPPAAGAAQDALEGGHGHAVLHQGLPGDHLRSVRPPAGVPVTGEVAAGSARRLQLVPGVAHSWRRKPSAVTFRTPPSALAQPSGQGEGPAWDAFRPRWESAASPPGD